MSRKDQQLIEAAEKGNLQAVKDLIAQGADINASEVIMGLNTKVTPLMKAAVKGHREVVEYLLTFPHINVNAMNAGGTTALMVAVRGEPLSKKNNHGHIDVVRVLIADSRVNVNQLGKFGGTALMNAAGFGEIEIVRELLKVPGISLEATYTDKKHSPITIAKQNGHLAVVELLEQFAAEREKTAKPAPQAKPPFPSL